MASNQVTDGLPGTAGYLPSILTGGMYTHNPSGKIQTWDFFFFFKSKAIPLGGILNFNF